MPTHDDRGVSAARSIAAAVQRVADVRIGIGVHSGTVAVGTIGGVGHLEFAVIGDAVKGLPDDLCPCPH